MIKTSTVILLLLIAPLSEGQEVPELLTPVDAYKAQRLVEYNGSWLQAELYPARRFRIVIADTSLLLRDDDFTFTPFDDVAPIRLTQAGVLRWEDSVAWNALMRIDLPPLIEAAGGKPTVLLSMVGWDTDESGKAVSSSEARYTKLETLKQHAFYSLYAAFELSPDSKYMLVPLKYTPKYSVIFEVAPERQVQFIVDPPPDGQVLNRNADELARLSDYENFMRTLPPDQNVPVVEDVQ